MKIVVVKFKGERMAGSERRLLKRLRRSLRKHRVVKVGALHVQVVSCRSYYIHENLRHVFECVVVRGPNWAEVELTDETVQIGGTGPIHPNCRCCLQPIVKRRREP